jgi:hypothetical protein
VRPRIVGPDRWPAAGDPPEFTVDGAGLPFWMVELATTRLLMRTVENRGPDNYFYGGDADGVFGTGRRWRPPAPAWRRLRPAGVLYYRLVAFDQGGCGGWGVSVDDEHLDELPCLLVGETMRTAQA